jgi:hypothetical protein
MARRKVYDDKFRTSAVIMLEAAGYPKQEGALTRTAAELGIPYRTLSRWFNKEQNPPPDYLVREKRGELADVFEDIAYKYLTHASKDDVVEETQGKDAIIAAATATDKMRLLRGLPTEIVALMPEVISAINKMGKDPVTIFNDIIRRANERTADRPVD